MPILVVLSVSCALHNVVQSIEGADVVTILKAEGTDPEALEREGRADLGRSSNAGVNRSGSRGDTRHSARAVDGRYQAMSGVNCTQGECLCVSALLELGCVQRAIA